MYLTDSPLAKACGFELHLESLDELIDKTVDHCKAVCATYGDIPVWECYNSTVVAIIRGEHYSRNDEEGGYRVVVKRINDFSMTVKTYIRD